MPRFVIDSNVYIDAIRQPAALVALKDFLGKALSRTFLSAVVHHELLAGTTSARQVALLNDAFAEPFTRRNRVVVPTGKAWREAGRLLCVHRLPGSASIVNDLLLAVSCRELEITIISRDTDLHRIARLVPGLSVVPPYPST